MTSDAGDHTHADPTPPIGSGPATRDKPASRLATLIGRVTLRMGGYPMRQWVGSAFRAGSRREGGYGFHVTTPDGLRLHAWHWPAAPNQPQRLPIIMSHGWIEVKEFHFNRARRLSQRGHEVVLFDHRGHGRSAAAAATFGVSEQGDLNAVIDASHQRGIVGDRVITLGFSMGAATSLRHAADDPRVAAVVAFAPFVDLRQAVRSFRDKLASYVPDRWLMPGFERATREAGYQIDRASTIEAIKRLAQPVMLIEGSRDRNLPPARHVEPLASAKTTGRLERYVVDGATHMSLCRSIWPGLDDAIDRFCDEVTENLNTTAQPKPQHT